MKHLTECPTCGKTNVRRQGSILMNVTSPYDNGAVYPRGQHTDEACAREVARRAELDAEQAERDEKSAWVDYRLAIVDAHMDGYVARYGYGAPEVVARWETLPTLEEMRVSFDASRKADV